MPVYHSLKNGFNVKAINYELHPMTLNKLKSAEMEHGINIKTLLFSAFAYLQSLLSAGDDPVVGIVEHNRPLCGDGDIVPVKIQVKGINTWEEYLRYVKEVLQRIKPYETTEIKRGVEQDNTEFVKTIFNYVDFHAYSQLEIKAVIETGPDINNYEKANTAFDFTIVNEGNRLVLWLTYQEELFSDWQINDSIKFYENILDMILNNTKGKIDNNQILGNEYIHMLLDTFNNTKAEYPKDKPIHELFEEQVERTPENIAVVYGDSELTYRQLNERANSLAWLLRKKGIVPDTIVGVMAEHSLEMMVGILGVLKAGGAYLPIDPGYPKDRIKYILCESGANILLSKGKFIEKLEHSGEFIDLEDKSIYSGKKANPPQINNSKNLAYVIYTSGSTGTPKGVLIEHNSLLNLCFWYIRNYNVTNKDRATKCAGFGFDASVCEIYPYIISGATIHIISEEMKLYAEKINDYYRENGITIGFLPTQLCEQFMEYENSSLRILLTGGDKLKKFKQKSYMLIDNYGPTENTVVTTSFKIGREYANIPIGKPIDNTKIYILSRDNSLQPIGVAGELCISGDGLARGYLNSPELTAEKFVDNPYFPGERMYKTGDLARWLPDGNIEFISRMDNQVKIRGFRIEVGEIEVRLLKHESVKEAVVEAREDKSGNKYLCAYIVSEGEIPVQELRTHLAEGLPGYMIPQYFIHMEKIPLNQNGKIDRKALPKPEGNINTGVQYIAPGNEVEEKLAKVWKEVLGVDRVGINDNFFELGGDSIKAIQVSAGLQRHQLMVDTGDLLMNPTIGKLSGYVKKAIREIYRGIVQGEVELTPIQRWYFEKEYKAVHHFNQAYMLYRKEGFLESAVRKAFDKILEHHDALRMIYRKESGRVIQVNRGREEKHYDIETVDLIGREEYEREIEEKCSMMQSIIDLSCGPLVKLCLFRTSKGDHLLIVIHRLVVDGISWIIIFEDFEAAYMQCMENKEIKLPEKTDSFKEWAKKINEYAKERELEEEREYWEKVCSCKAARLSKENAAQSNRVGDSISRTVTLTEDETSKLQNEVNKAYNTEINDILLTALGLTAKDWTGEDNVLVNLEDYGREVMKKDIDISRTVGCFTVMYPVVLDMKKPEDLSYQIKMVKETLRRVPNKGIGYGILRYLSGGQENLNINPEISFNYLGQFGQDIFLREALSGELEHTGNIEVNCIIINGKLHINLSFIASEYDLYTIEGITNKYLNNLQKVIIHCIGKEEAEMTPSDMFYNDFSIDEFESLENELGGFI